MTQKLSGDPHYDQDSLTVIVGKFLEAYIDFDIDPHVDEVAEVSMWSRELLSFATKLEQGYGKSATKAMLARSWREVRE
jgi:hypothetical protein